jgi:hypothetical protein
VVVGVCRQRHDVDAGLVAEATGCLDAVAAGHAQVHQDHVRALLARQCQRLLTVGGRAHHLHPLQQVEQQHQPVSDYALVVGYHDADGHVGSHSVTRNPEPVGPADRVPPSSSARSRMPVIP